MALLVLAEGAGVYFWLLDGNVESLVDAGLGSHSLAFLGRLGVGTRHVVFLDCRGRLV